MIKILILAPYPVDSAPSQRFRFEQYFQTLTGHDIEFTFQSFLDDRTWKILYKPGKGFQKIWGIIKGFGRRKLMLFRAGQFDYVFIHREATPIGPPVFEFIIAKVLNKKIIYDFDDAIWLPDTRNESTFIKLIKWKSKVQKIAGWSYKVSVGNRYLAEFAREFCENVVLNPTTIDTIDMHRLDETNHNQNSKICIGWTGTHSTLKYLDPLIPLIRDLCKQLSIEFIVISNRKPSWGFEGLKYISWSKITEIQDLNKIDIGIMPLDDDQWSKGKCGFKALQYMALEKPALVSPVGVNNEMIAHGVNGFLCNSLEQWKRHLADLVESEELRRSIGREGRKTVENRYSVRSNSENFLKLFS